MDVSESSSQEAAFKAPLGGKSRPSMRQAINRMCRSCIYDPQSGLGNWRQQVQQCAITDCPLWELRPVSKPK